MNGTERPDGEPAAPNANELGVRSELGHCRATVDRLRDVELAKAALAIVQRLEDGIGEVMDAARADGQASDIAQGRLEEAASKAVLQGLRQGVMAFAHERLLQADDLVAFELLPRLLIVHTELARLAMHVRFEHAGRAFTDSLREQSNASALMLLGTLLSQSIGGRTRT